MFPMSLQTYVITMGGCDLQFGTSHQYIAQWQIDPMSGYCDEVSCPTFVA